jgi:hypothetical protein
MPIVLEDHPHLNMERYDSWSPAQARIRQAILGGDPGQVGRRGLASGMHPDRVQRVPMKVHHTQSKVRVGCGLRGCYSAM